MTVSVSPTQNDPRHHLSLSDGVTTVGFILSDQAGRIEPRALKLWPQQRTAIKTATGDSKYSDYMLPYMTIAQSDWSGGRGGEIFENDKTKFYDASRMNTTREGKLFLGPRENYATGHRSQIIHMPILNLHWIPLIGNDVFKSDDISVTAGFTTTKIEIWLKRVGTPGPLNVAIYDNDAGPPAHPGMNVLASASVTAAAITDTVSTFQSFTWAVPLVIAAFTGYHVVVYSNTTDTAANHWEVGCEYTAGSITLHSSADGLAWTVSDYTPYFRVLDAAVDLDGKFFVYKDALYLVTKPTSGDAHLWRNGTRNAVTGAFVANNSWTDLGTIGAAGSGPCTDVCVAGEFVYFAFGESVAVRRYQEYATGGAWTSRSAVEGDNAIYLCSIRDPVYGLYVYGARNAHVYYGVSVWRGKVPAAWGNLYYDLGQICPTNVPWDEQVIANVTQGTNTVATYIGIAAGFATGIAASRDIASPGVDVTGGKRLGWMAYSTAATAAGDLQLALDDVANCASPDFYNFPALAASTWQWCTADASPLKGGNSGRAVVSVGLKVAVDNGSMDVYLVDGIHLLANTLEYIRIPATKITGIVPYSGNASDPRENPWVFCQGQVFEIQTQNNNAVVPLPIGEMKEMSSDTTGKASATNDVNLYFNLGRRLEKYFSRNLDDTGAMDKDAGLPSTQIGDWVGLVSYPGMVFAAIDAGATGYSSILILKGQTWHELYRAPYGKRIKAIAHLVVPSINIGNLWFIQGNDLVYVQVSTNPLQETYYNFSHEGYLVTGWIYGGMQDVIKAFDRVKIFSDKVIVATKVEYQIDNATTWTTMATTFSTMPVQEATISSATPPNLTGRRIRFRITIGSNDNKLTPVLSAFILEAFGIVPTKYAYSFTGIVDEDEPQDLEGDDDAVLGYAASADAAIDKLITWANTAQRLTMNCVYAPANGLTVCLDPPAITPIQLLPDVHGHHHERYLAQCIVNEV